MEENATILTIIKRGHKMEYEVQKKVNNKKGIMNSGTHSTLSVVEKKGGDQ